MNLFSQMSDNSTVGNTCFIIKSEKLHLTKKRCFFNIFTVVFIVFIQFSQVKCNYAKSGSIIDWHIHETNKDRDNPSVNHQEPSDGEILQAVIQSMQSYYERQAARNGSNRNRNETIASGGSIPSQQHHHPQHHHMHKRDEEMVCYEDLGCFRDEGPFDYLDMLPLPPDRIQTQFLLYTRRNPLTPELMHYSNVTSMYTSLFNRSTPIKIMAHGFGSSCQKVWAVEMRKALLQVDDVNIICVDWHEGAALPNYVQAAANTRLVGKQVARLIRTLNVFRGTNNTNIHLIGFSLGAHVAGFAGDELRNISRITGLDPAAPLFEGYSTKARLDPSDANFVDVIHSNGDSLLYGGLGAFDPMGHVDYYPNGGKVQAGCSNIFVGAISDLIWYQPRVADGRSLCNHRRAYKFFADSMLPTCSFPAFACEDYEKFLQGDCFPCGPSNRNCGNMGYHSDKSLGRGKLFLLTRNSEPFCANQFKVIVESSPELTPTYGGLELTLISWNQVNETFQLTSEWEQLVPGQPLTRVIVAHPSLNNLISAQIKYTPYKGWITNGLEKWEVDRITVIDSFDRKYSFCRRGLPLTEGKPTTVYLRNEDCIESQRHPAIRPVTKNHSLADDNNNNNDQIKPFILKHGNNNNFVQQPPPPPPTNKIITKPNILNKKPIFASGPIVTPSDRTEIIEGTKLTNGSKILNKLQSQVMYFQFFPVPIRSRNGTTSTYRLKLKDTINYDPHTNKKQNLISARQHHFYGGGRPSSVSSNLVRLVPPSVGEEFDSLQRLGRKISLSDDVSPMRLASAPDISAQIVFVPSGRAPRVQYIPLRQRSSKQNEDNVASKRMSSLVHLSRSRVAGPLRPHMHTMALGGHPHLPSPPRNN